MNRCCAKSTKGRGPERMVEAGRRVREAGLKLSVTALLGIAGRERSLEHARATGEVLSAMDPNYVGVLSLMVLPNTEIGSKVEAGEFELLNPPELLKELREMLLHTNMTRGLFFSNHASNYLPLKVKMPADKEKGLAAIDEALQGQSATEAGMDEGILRNSRAEHRAGRPIPEPGFSECPTSASSGGFQSSRWKVSSPGAGGCKPRVMRIRSMGKDLAADLAVAGEGCVADAFADFDFHRHMGGQDDRPIGQRKGADGGQNDGAGRRVDNGFRPPPGCRRWSRWAWTR